MTGEFVIVRCKDAGVHMGTLDQVHGQSVLLKGGSGQRRLWRWRGANTLNEVAVNGVDEEYTRISEPVEEILLLDACEVIPCTPKAIDNLTRQRWGE